MDSWLQCWSLATLLCSLLIQCSTAADEKNGSLSLNVEEKNSNPKELAAGVLHTLLQKGVLDVEKSAARILGSGGEDSFKDIKSWGVKSKKSQKKLPASSAASTGGQVSSEVLDGQAKEISSTKGTLSLPSAAVKLQNESLTCVGCGGDTYNEKPPSRSLLSEHDVDNVESVTGLVWPLDQGTIDFDFRKSLVKGDRPSVTESQEDSGSGDPHMKTLSGQVTRSGSEIGLSDLMDTETSTLSQISTTDSITPINMSTEKAISPDSAEIDHLLQVSRETVLQPPSSSVSDQREVTFETGKSQEPTMEKSLEQLAGQGVEGGTNKTLLTEKPQEDFSSTSIPLNGPLKPSEPPSDPLDLDYHERSNLEDHWRFPHFPGSPFAGVDSTKSIHDKLGPWHKTVHYDDFPPFDDTYFYPTPSFYADGYEEVGIEDDDEDDDLEEVDDEDDITARGVGDIPKVPTSTPNIQTPGFDTKPTGRQNVFFHGELPPKSYPDGNRDQTHSLSGTHDNSTECRSGYVRRNNTCKSICDIYPTYCYNGGQCYIVENIGAFCRCNTQDYIWHKGLRCESIITDFQVMCVAVGTAALVVLLLFMMTVFFAKKLYLLKTENYKLRKRKYRTPSELHNDNFSLSTIAEGSHPNVRKLCDTPSKLSPHVRAMAYYDNVICQEDPNAPQKVQDLPKACLKDEEPFNIQNSLSPKHESVKGDPDIVDVNCVLNNLT
ncbi:chondroitin sulfate proteoglycan 5 isoform X2 [Bufo bufo]|uniref:chondroitin sulfate proteoglycan 5 isoform X2 n=1 Tax=Bufo bufo TaxID=8384 RepID=UPI001ABE5BB3|nr:chondroitin sulfate proteoglycan 5 isoform X2 [Bufo bufo]